MLNHQKIVIAGESRGTTEVLAPLARELMHRGCEVKIFAVGTEAEATGFGELPFVHMPRCHTGVLEETLAGVHLLVTGATGRDSTEWTLLEIARRLAIRSACVLDNIDNLLERLDPDPAKWPDRILVSGQIGCEDLKHALQLPHNKNNLEDKLTRFAIVDNLRNDAAISSRHQFSPSTRRDVLQSALLFPDAEFPSYLDRRRLLSAILDGNAKLVVFFSQNIEPSSPHWKAYGRTEKELVASFAGKLVVMVKALAALRSFDGVYVAVRPHPREMSSLGRQIAADFGAIYLPPEAGDSLSLAMASGYIVTPASSIIDQGPLHGVRTAALLFEQEGPFRFEALKLGAVLTVLDAGQLPQAIAELVSDDLIFARRWCERLRKHASVAAAAPRIVDSLIDWFQLA